MEILILIFNPITALVISGVFLFEFRKNSCSLKSKNILLVSCVLWAIYAIWEIYVLSWRSPTGDRAIRIDLVLFGPVILSAAIVGIITIFKGRSKFKSRSKDDIS